MTVQILIGDVRERLAELPADHFDCVVTSPPYWGLRDYDVEGQIGLEPTLGEHLSVMVEVIEHVRRVLKPTGSLWLNYGDCYATSPNGRSAVDTKATGKDDRTFRDKPFSTIGGMLKAKDLCMVPNRLAIALQEAGWWVRSEIIWAKPNPMPESITDRPATAHEKIFLLSRSPRYFYDQAAVRQATVGQNEHDITGGRYAPPGQQPHTGTRKPGVGEKLAKMRASDIASPRHAGHINHTGIEGTPRGYGRSLRNYEPAPVQVWNVATRPFAEAHFATFPPELAERCLKAGCPTGGHVLDPFGGAGTTALVADALGMDCTLIELNEDYAAIAQRRLKAALAAVSGADESRGVDPLPLFAGASS